jgi:hypothetical protein
LIKENAQMTGVSEHNDNLVAATLAAAIVQKWNQLSHQLQKDAANAMKVYDEVLRQLEARKRAEEQFNSL